MINRNRTGARTRLAAAALAAGIAVLMPACAWAEAIYVAAVSTPVLVEKDNRGVVARVAQRIGKAAGMDIRFRLYPEEQVPIVYQEGRADAMLTRSYRDLGYAHARIQPFYVSKIYAFRREGASRIYRIYHLRGKQVGLTKDYPFDPDFLAQLRKSKVKLMPQGSDVVSFKMLVRDQIFAFLAEEHSARASLSISDAEGVTYDARSPLWKRPLSLLFPRTAEGEARARRFENAYRKLLSDGEYDRLLKELSS